MDNELWQAYGATSDRELAKWRGIVKLGTSFEGHLINIIWYEGYPDIASVCNGPPEDEAGLRPKWQRESDYYVYSVPLRHPYATADYYHIVAQSLDDGTWLYGVADLASVATYNKHEMVYVAPKAADFSTMEGSAS